MKYQQWRDAARPMFLVTKPGGIVALCGTIRRARLYGRTPGRTIYYNRPAVAQYGLLYEARA